MPTWSRGTSAARTRPAWWLPWPATGRCWRRSGRRCRPIRFCGNGSGLGFRRDIADLIAASDFVGAAPRWRTALPTCADLRARPSVGRSWRSDVGGTCGHGGLRVPELLVEAGRPAALRRGDGGDGRRSSRSDPAAVAAIADGGAAPVRGPRSVPTSGVRRLRSLYQTVIGGRRRSSGHRIRAGESSRRSGGLLPVLPATRGGAAHRGGDDVEPHHRTVPGVAAQARTRVAGSAVLLLPKHWHPAAGSEAPGWWRRVRRARSGPASTRAAWLVLIAHLRRTPPGRPWSCGRRGVSRSNGWGVRAVRRSAAERGAAGLGRT